MGQSWKKLKCSRMEGKNDGFECLKYLAGANAVQIPHSPDAAFLGEPSEGTSGAGRFEGACFATQA